jgi:AcrR family transcriptional regulator
MGVQERKARQKENLRQEILDAARDLFAHQGVESVSMRKIAERIEYSPGTIYLYFNDKNEILKTLCDETFSRLHQKIQAIRDDKSEPLSSLRRGLRAYIEFGLQNPNHYMVTFVLAGRALHENQNPGWERASFHGTPKEQDLELDSGHRCFDNLRGIVRKCIEEGLFRIDDVEEASQVLWAGVHGITTLLITKPGFPFVEQTRLVERVVEVLVEGVRRA